ncbi:phage major capsid protein [Paenibacillus sp. sgz302251]|uniref:phage major capsid protein n=1 Tax=Paenibacillus sp. sgz302251 TaxID=3414493 RepID=UPI003C7A18A4
MNRLQEIAARLQEIRSALAGTGQVDVAALQAEVEALNAEKGNIEARNALMNGIPENVTAVTVPNPANTTPAAEVDRFNTIEYRNAFMKFAKTGVMAPEFSGQEYRANATTAVADATAVVPTTILNEMLVKLYTTGQIYKRVRKLNIQGGVQVPILSLKPVATWIGETAVSDRQKVQANTNVTFTYFGLECRVSQTLLSNTVTLAAFESTIISLIVEAMARALDVAIIKGTGVGQPLGITVDPRVVAGQTVTLSKGTAKEFSSWEAWQKKVMAKIPLSYSAGGTFIMAKGTFEAQINGMVGTDGQPIGRVNYGITDGSQERFAGKEVILVEDDVIKPCTDQAASVVGDILAIFVRLDDYAINSNMQMQMARWFDQDKNEWVDKAILICDGKLIDPDGVIIVKVAA